MLFETAILGLTIAGYCLIADGDTSSMTREEHHAIVIEHLAPPLRAGAGLPTPFILELDQNGPRAEIEQILGGAALGLAANYYAAATLDFDVCVRDVIEFGLWPFDTIPEDFDLEGRLFDFKRITAMAGPYELDEDLAYGSPMWRIIAKNQILRLFYEDYYLLNFKYRQTMAGEGSAGNYSSGDLEFSQNIIIEAGYPLDYPLNQIPQLVSGFWFNDLEDRPTDVGTGLAGDIELVKLSGLLMISNDRQAKLEADIQVPAFRMYAASN